MKRLIETIKRHNPICQKMNEYKESARELRQSLRDNGKEALQKTVLKGEKSLVRP